MGTGSTNTNLWMLQYNSNSLRNSEPFSEDNPLNMLGLCAEDTAMFGGTGTAAIIITGMAGTGLTSGRAGGGEEVTVVEVVVVVALGPPEDS